MPHHADRMVMRHLLLIVVCGVVMGACTARRDHTVMLEGIETKSMTLEPRNTRVPNITLRVPENFERDWTESKRGDSFIIFNPDDDGDVQRGMLIVNITADIFQHIHDSLKTKHSRSTISGETIEWRERSFTDDDGVRLHQREAIRRGAFKLFTDPTTKQELLLQVFVVGTDSVLVEQLMGSAETIVIGGGPPDV